MRSQTSLEQVSALRRVSRSLATSLALYWLQPNCHSSSPPSAMALQ